MLFKSFSNLRLIMSFFNTRKEYQHILDDNEKWTNRPNSVKNSAAKFEMQMERKNNAFNYRAAELAVDAGVLGVEGYRYFTGQFDMETEGHIMVGYIPARIARYGLSWLLKKRPIFGEGTLESVKKEKRESTAVILFGEVGAAAAAGALEQAQEYFSRGTARWFDFGKTMIGGLLALPHTIIFNYLDDKDEVVYQDAKKEADRIFPKEEVPTKMKKLSVKYLSEEA